MGLKMSHTCRCERVVIVGEASTVECSQGSGVIKASEKEAGSKKPEIRGKKSSRRRTHCHPKGATHGDDVPLHVPLGEAPVALAKC